ncbi:MAG: hypothetical protein QG646_3464 [Euryarchaeota archaeon]|nr:hypothetical protein [Euryarchaeota archaeon]
MKQLNSFSILLVAFILVLLAPNLTKAELLIDTAEIPYQINNSDHIVIGTVSGINVYYNYTMATITVEEWLYNPLPDKTIKVRNEIGTNVNTEDQPVFTQNESTLLMLSDIDSMFTDKDIDKDLFIVSVAFPGKHPASDRDAVIKELKAQGKWQEGNQTVSETNNTVIEDGIIDNSSNNNSNNTDITPQSLPLTFGPETINKLKSDPNFIAAYGNIPSFTTSEERKQWLDKLNNVYQGAISEMSKYEYPNGPVTAFGYSIDGVLQVGINSSKTVEKPLMDEIYKIFDSKASLIGIKEVPMVFVYQDNPVPTVITGEPEVKETSDLSKSNNGSSNINNSTGYKSDRITFAPDFRLLGSLICLYGWMEA